MQVITFVDYDNVKPIRAESTDVDASQNISQIAEKAVQITKDRFGGASEVLLRLYDGWLDIKGHPTERALRVMRTIGALPRRIQGVRVNPTIVVGPIFFETSLRGLVKSGEQKMVDSLLVSDLTWSSLQLDCPLVVMSDDDDMVPGLLSALVSMRLQYQRQPLCLSRQRAQGDGINDDTLTKLGIYYEGAI